MEINPQLVNWIGTYLVHSTFLILGVSLWIRWSSEIRLSVQNTIWRVVLVAPILTTSVALAVEYPFLSWQETSIAESELHAYPKSSPSQSPSLDGERVSTRFEQPLVPGLANHKDQLLATGQLQLLPNSRAIGPDESVSMISGVSEHRLLSQRAVDLCFRWLAAFCLLFSGLGLILFCLRGVRVVWLLRSRVPIDDVIALDCFSGLCLRAAVNSPIQLSCCDGLDSPVALGFRRKEICMPSRALRELKPGPLAATFAHELAHLQRRDPIWQALASLIEHIFSFQPLIRIARQKMRDTMEFLADDWVVLYTGTGLDLARSLAIVASWKIRKNQVELLPAMVSETRSGLLIRRVQRLLDDTTERTTKMRGMRHMFLITGILVAGSLFAPEVVVAKNKNKMIGISIPTPELASNDFHLNDEVSGSQTAAQPSNRFASVTKKSSAVETATSTNPARPARSEAGSTKSKSSAAAKSPRAVSSVVSPASPSPGSQQLSQPSQPSQPSQIAPPLPDINLDFVEPMVNGLVAGIMPVVKPLAQGTVSISRLAMRVAAMEQTVAAKQSKLAQARREGKNDAVINQYQQELKKTKAQLRAAEKKLKTQTKSFETEMEQLGQEFERNIGPKIEKAVEKIEPAFERWGEQFEIAMEQWAKEIERELQSPPASRSEKSDTAPRSTSTRKSR